MAIKFKGTETSGLLPVGLGERELALNLADKTIYSVDTNSTIVEFLGTDRNATWGNITGNILAQSDLLTSLNNKEDSLGIPVNDGQILSSSVSGVRSWIEPTSLTGSKFIFLQGDVSNTTGISSSWAKVDTWTVKHPDSDLVYNSGTITVGPALNNKWVKIHWNFGGICTGNNRSILQTAIKVNDVDVATSSNYAVRNNSYKWGGVSGHWSGIVSENDTIELFAKVFGAGMDRAPLDCSMDISMLEGIQGVPGLPGIPGADGGTIISADAGNIATISGIDGYIYVPPTNLNPYQLVSDKAQPNGYASLDVNGLIPSNQIPAGIDEVIEHDDLASFPAVGVTSAIYVALNTNKTYRWSGSTYVLLNEGVVLGETSATAYRGDRGVIAFNHTSDLSNPHAITKSQIGLGSADNTPDISKPISSYVQTALDSKINTSDSIDVLSDVDVTSNLPSEDDTLSFNGTNWIPNSSLFNHTSNNSNPHNITKSQIYLGSVNNTSDANKPISNATQVALDSKEDDLGTPLSDGLVLSSLMDGTRSWVSASGSSQGATAYALLNGGDMSFNTVGTVVRFNSASYLGEAGVYSLNNSSNVGRLSFLQAGAYNLVAQLSIKASDAGIFSDNLDVSVYWRYNGSDVTGVVYKLENMEKDQILQITANISGTVVANDFLELVIKETGGNLNGTVINTTASLTASRV